MLDVSELGFNIPLEYLPDISSDVVCDVPYCHLKKIIHHFNEILFF